MSWIVLVAICISILCMGYILYSFICASDRFKSHTRKEIALLSASNRAALFVGLAMVFSGVFINLSPDGELAFLNRLMSSVCLSVGGSLSGVGLYALFEVQDKRSFAESSSKLVFMTRSEYRDKYGYEDFI